MTPPTREQVVKWAKQSGVVIYSQVEAQTIGILTDFATLAQAGQDAKIADLEAQLKAAQDQLASAEQRTAEACAKACRCIEDEEAIRSGSWRKFVNGE